MTTERFMELMKEPLIHDYIWQQARRHSLRLELQEEYVQEAWLALSLMPDDWNLEAYRELIFKTIYSAYWQNHKELMLLSAGRPARATRCQRGFIGTERDEKAQAHNWRE